MGMEVFISCMQALTLSPSAREMVMLSVPVRPSLSVDCTSFTCSKHQHALISLCTNKRQCRKQ